MPPNVVACNALMHAYSRAHRPGDAARVMRGMLANQVRPNMTTYNTLLDAHARVSRAHAHHPCRTSC